MALVEFDSQERVKDCYDDPAYTEAKRFTAAASRRQLMIIEGGLR
ncbi:DUF1330 domain-containing protein [Pseudomonas sp. ATCC 13867]|nr:DUF1330 domain-containing protein [Pseudomonas sp. ATCC 13867]